MSEEKTTEQWCPCGGPPCQTPAGHGCGLRDVEPLPPLPDYERAARAYCHMRGWDPNERVVMPPHPEGYAVMRFRPRWREVEAMLREHVEHQRALAAALEGLTKP